MQTAETTISRNPAMDGKVLPQISMVAELPPCEMFTFDL
jgi:hypothetical protein